LDDRNGRGWREDGHGGRGPRVGAGWDCGNTMRF
jgi:hypothetical protein